MLITGLPVSGYAMETDTIPEEMTETGEVRGTEGPMGDPDDFGIPGSEDDEEGHLEPPDSDVGIDLTEIDDDSVDPGLLESASGSADEGVDPDTLDDAGAQSDYVGGVKRGSGQELWYSDFESFWNAAILGDAATPATARLFKDWIADSSKKRSFGKSGNGFTGGTIFVPKGAYVTLDLNGHMIDRHLTCYDMSDPRNYWKGYSVITVAENAYLTIKDSDPGVRHDGYFDADMGLWIPKYRTRYPSVEPVVHIKFNTNRPVPIYGGIICGGAGTSGGGLSNYNRNSNIIIEGGNIVGNTSKYGGGVCNDCAHLEMKGGLIGYNYANSQGGGVYTKSAENKWRSVASDSQDFTMTGGIIKRNTANYNNGGLGGGVYCDCTDHALSLSRKTMQFFGGTICGNSAYKGGGLFQNQGRVELNGGIISENWANYYGGGVVANGYFDNLIQGRDTLLSISGAAITGNTAQWGGGLYVNTKKCDIASVTITNNTASATDNYPGAGVYIANGDYVQFKGGNVVIQDNYKTRGGASNVSCQNFSDFNGSRDRQNVLGTSSCMYVGFRNENDFKTGAKFGTYLKGTPGTIQLDDSGYYAEPDPNYENGWTIKWKPAKGSVLYGNKTYSYTDSKGARRTATAVRGTFTYASVLDMTDLDASYYYTDAFFTNTGNNGALNYDQQLATMSCALAMSAFRRPFTGAANQAKNVNRLMTDLGMKNISITYPEPQRFGANDYTIGYAIGTKTLTEGEFKGKTLVTIATRGANYMTEWGSNTTINPESAIYNRQSSGFSDAADKVTRGVTDYLERNNIKGDSSDVLFWITGYSRGGATANLTAQRLTDLYDSSGKRIYAYPIEAPQGAWHDGITGGSGDFKPAKSNPADYRNIHNIINPSDLVPRVAPSIMGFSRFGTDHLIPGNTYLSDNSATALSYKSYDKNKNNTFYAGVREKMITQLAALDPRIGFSDQFRYGTMAFIGSVVNGTDMVKKNGDFAAPEDWYDSFLRNLINFTLRNYPEGYPETHDEKNQNQKRPSVLTGKDKDIAYRELYSLTDPLKTGSDGVPQFAYNATPEYRLNIQQTLETVIVLVFGLGKEDSEKLTDSLGKLASALDRGFKCSDGTTLEMSSMYTGFIRKWYDLSFDEKNVKIKELWEFISLAQLDKVLTKAQYSDLKRVFPVLVNFALNGASYDWKKADSDYLGTLLGNAETIAQAHYPEVNFAWLRAQDYLYEDDGKDVYIGKKWQFGPTKEVSAEITGVSQSEIFEPGKDGNAYITVNSGNGKLALRSKTDGAVILYTSNGNKPKLDGDGTCVYTSPIPLTGEKGSKTEYSLRMVAYKNGVYSPETTFRCDVFPDHMRYTLTVEKEEGRKEKQKLESGEVTNLNGYSKNKLYKFVGWNLITLPGSQARNDKMEEIRAEEMKKRFSNPNGALTSFTMPRYDVTIEAQYVKLVDNIHIQLKENVKLKANSKVEWMIENGRKGFRSPGYVLPSDVNPDDFKIVNVYPKLKIDMDENKDGGQDISLYFVPSEMDPEMPEFCLEDGNAFKLYINDVLVYSGGRNLMGKTSSSIYGTLKGYAGSQKGALPEYCAVVNATINQVGNIGLRSRLVYEFCYRPGTPMNQIAERFPTYSEFVPQYGSRTYLVKNIWQTDKVDYDPQRRYDQRFEVLAEPDEADFRQRYGSDMVDPAKVMKAFRDCRIRCSVYVLGFSYTQVPQMIITRAAGETTGGRWRGDPYEKPPTLTLKYNGRTDRFVNFKLRYSLDGGKNFLDYTGPVLLDYAKLGSKDHFSVCAQAIADNAYKDTAYRRSMQEVYLVRNRTVRFEMAYPDFQYSLHYSDRWKKAETGYGGELRNMAPGAEIFLNGLEDSSSNNRDLGIATKFELRYGNESEVIVLDSAKSGGDYNKWRRYTTDTKTRNEDGTPRNLTVKGIYDLGIHKLRLKLDDNGRISEVWVNTYLDGTGAPVSSYVKLDPSVYEVSYNEEGTEAYIELTPGKGYCWSNTMTSLEKAEDDTVIERLYADNRKCSYSLRVVMNSESRRYPVNVEQVSEDGGKKDYVLGYFFKGNIVQLSAPEWIDHPFKKWTAVSPAGLEIKDPENADHASITMPVGKVTVRAEYGLLPKIEKATLFVPSVYAEHEIGGTAVPDEETEKVLTALTFWKRKDKKKAGYNEEVVAEIWLKPNAGYRFADKENTGLQPFSIDADFILEAQDGRPLTLRKSYRHGDHVILEVVQRTGAGVVKDVSWGETVKEVSASSLPYGDAAKDHILRLIPDGVAVNVFDQTDDTKTNPVTMDIKKEAPVFDEDNSRYTVKASLPDTGSEYDFNTGSVEKTVTYTVIVKPDPLDIRKVEWGKTVYEVSEKSQEADILKAVPDEFPVTFKSVKGNEFVMWIGAKKALSGESSPYTVTATLDIEVDAEGTKGYTNKDNIPLSQAFTVKIPDYYSVEITGGNAEGYTEREFDAPVFKDGKLRPLEKGDGVIAYAEAAEGERFVKWEVTGFDPDDEELTDPVLYFDMPDNDVTVKAVYDKAITDISFEFGESGASLISVSINNGAEILNPDCYTAVSPAERIWRISLKPGSGWFFDEDLKLNESEETARSIRNLERYSADFVLDTRTHKVSVTPVDRDGVPVEDFGTVIAGGYDENETVSVNVLTVPDYCFQEWKTGDQELVLHTDENDRVTFTMPSRDVELKPVYDPYVNIRNLPLTVTRAVPFSPLADKGTVTVKGESAPFVTGKWEGWLSGSVAFNEEVSAVVRLIPKKGSRFPVKNGAADVDLTVDAGGNEAGIVKSVLQTDGSLLVTVKQKTPKGTVTDIDWGKKVYKVYSDAIPDGDAGLEAVLNLLPDSVDVRCEDPGDTEKTVSVNAVIERSAPVFDGDKAVFTVRAAVNDDGNVFDFDTHSVERFTDYTVEVRNRPLNVKSIEWGTTEFTVSEKATDQEILDTVPDSVRVDFGVGDPETLMTLSVPVKKTLTGDSSPYTVNAALDIVVDAEGSQGYTNKDNVKLDHDYTVSVPEYYTASVTGGSAEGITYRTFDLPEWDDENGVLNHLEEADSVMAEADYSLDTRFRRWDVSGIEGLTEDELTDPVLVFDMPARNVSLTAAFDREIYEISPEISEDRKNVLSLYVNESVSIPGSEFTTESSGDRLTVKLKADSGYYFSENTELTENEVAVQAVSVKDDRTAEFLLAPEILAVYLRAEDEEGFPLQDTEEIFVGVFRQGDRVTTYRDEIEGYRFKEWSTEPEELALTTGEDGRVSFEMPDQTVTLHAVYSPYKEIEYVDLSITAPVRGEKLPDPKTALKAVAEGGSLNDAKTVFSWDLEENEVPGYGETVTGRGVVYPADDSIFLTWGDSLVASFMLDDNGTEKEITDVNLLPDGGAEFYVDFTMDKRLLSGIDWGDTEITDFTVNGDEPEMFLLPASAGLLFNDSAPGEEPVLRPIIWPDPRSLSQNRIVKTETDDAVVYRITGEIDLRDDIGGYSSHADYEDFEGDDGWLDPGKVELTKEFTLTLVREGAPEVPAVELEANDTHTKMNVSFIADDECTVRYNYAFSTGDEMPEVADPSAGTGDHELDHKGGVQKIVLDIPGDNRGQFVNFRIKAISEVESISEPGVKLVSGVRESTVSFFVPGDKTLTVDFKDINGVPCKEKYIDPDSGDEMERSSYKVDELSAGSKVSLASPVTGDEVFFRWEVPADLAITADTLSGTLSENSLDLDTTKTRGYTNRYITVEMPDSDVSVTARFIPVVNEVNVKIAEPEAGEPLIRKADRVSIRVTEEYVVDPVNIDVWWSGVITDTKGTVYDDEAYWYDAQISLSPDDDGKITLTPVKGGAQVKYDVSDIIFSAGASIKVNGSEAEEEDAFLGTDEDGIPFVLLSFVNGALPVEEKDGPDGAQILSKNIDNEFGLFLDEDNEYEYSFDGVNVLKGWRADISDQAGKVLYVRYAETHEEPASKWTKVQLPAGNGELPEPEIDHENDRVGFRGVDKWQYYDENEGCYKAASASSVKLEELGWDGKNAGISVRMSGDSLHFPGAVSTLTLSERPAAPAGLRFVDISSDTEGLNGIADVSQIKATQGAVVGFFDHAAGKTIEVWVRYPGRSDDWDAYDQGRVITVENSGIFTLYNIADSNAEFRVRILDSEDLPSEWAYASCTVANPASDELFVEKRYSVSYVIERSGKRVSDTTKYSYRKDVKTEDGKKYGISANRDWFDERLKELYGTDGKASFVGFSIVGRSVNSDGSDGTVEGQEQNETVLAQIRDSEYEDGDGGVVYSDIPIDYNEITVYARVGSYATVRDETEGVYVVSPLPVRYTGLAHKLTFDPAAGKKNANKSANFDLDLVVRDSSHEDEFGEDYSLVYGVDYTVKYRNNKNASLSFNAVTGEYTPLYADAATAQKKGPQLILTGKGNYKGMKAVVSYDILPLSIHSANGAVGVFRNGGLADSYVIGKKGGIKLKVKPVRQGRVYDKEAGCYRDDTRKTTAYNRKDISMTLQKLDDDSRQWITVGSLDGKNANETLKKVTTEGRYRVKYAGVNNFCGTGLYDEFDVYGTGKVLFSSLKLKTAKKSYQTGGLSANQLVTGFSTAVRNRDGRKVALSPDEYELSIEPKSDTACVEDNKAMSAGTYTVKAYFTGDIANYPDLAADGPAAAVVTVKGEKLKASMVSLDWSKKGELFDGKARDVNVTLNGISASEVALGKPVMADGKVQYVPMSDEDLAVAVKESADKGFSVNGSYTLADGTRVDNTLPGKYSIALIGKGRFSGSVFTAGYRRIPAPIMAEMVYVSPVQFNIAGNETAVNLYDEALGIDVDLEGKGNADYALAFGGFKKSVSENRIGTAVVTVKVKSEVHGLKKGSSVKVPFDVSQRLADVMAYRDYDHYNPGTLYVKVSQDVVKGAKAPKVTVFQSGEDGVKLKKLADRYFTASFSKRPASEGVDKAAPAYDLKLTEGKTAGFYDFGEEGCILEDVYSEYEKKASRWGNAVFGDTAGVIPDLEDGTVYTDRSLDEYDHSTVRFDTTGKVPSVSYVGKSYILPVIEEVVVDGVTLKREDGDFIITYSGNNKTGTAKMTVTLTRGGSEKTVSYPLGGSRTYKFRIVAQSNTNLAL